MGNKARAAEGRFSGARRVNVEEVPRLPIFPAAWTLADPRRRPYLVFWTRLDGTLAHVARMEREEDGRGLRITIPYRGPHRVAVLRREMPRKRGGETILYRCPTCQRPRRYLYLLSRVADRLVDSCGPQCPACAGLRWASQGRYIPVGIRELCAAVTGIPGYLEPMPRKTPWDPRAVSDPALVMNQFPESFRYFR
jgi:hypothetical protein